MTTAASVGPKRGGGGVSFAPASPFAFCAVSGCYTSQRDCKRDPVTGDGKTLLFPFPARAADDGGAAHAHEDNQAEQAALRDIWVDFCARTDDLETKPHICSKHFLPAEYDVSWDESAGAWLGRLATSAQPSLTPPRPPKMTEAAAAPPPPTPLRQPKKKPGPKRKDRPNTADLSSAAAPAAADELDVAAEVGGRGRPKRARRPPARLSRTPELSPVVEDEEEFLPQPVPAAAAKKGKRSAAADTGAVYDCLAEASRRRSAAGARGKRAKADWGEDDDDGDFIDDGIKIELPLSNDDADELLFPDDDGDAVDPSSVTLTTPFAPWLQSTHEFPNVSIFCHDRTSYFSINGAVLCATCPAARKLMLAADRGEATEDEFVLCDVGEAALAALQQFLLDGRMVIDTADVNAFAKIMDELRHVFGALFVPVPKDFFAASWQPRRKKPPGSSHAASIDQYYSWSPSSPSRRQSAAAAANRSGARRHRDQRPAPRRRVGMSGFVGGDLAPSERKMTDEEAKQWKENILAQNRAPALTPEEKRRRMSYTRLKGRGPRGADAPLDADAQLNMDKIQSQAEHNEAAVASGNTAADQEDLGPVMEDIKPILDNREDMNKYSKAVANTAEEEMTKMRRIKGAQEKDETVRDETPAGSLVPWSHLENFLVEDKKYLDCIFDGCSDNFAEQMMPIHMEEIHGVSKMKVLLVDNLDWLLLCSKAVTKLVYIVTDVTTFECCRMLGCGARLPAPLARHHLMAAHGGVAVDSDGADAAAAEADDKVIACCVAGCKTKLVDKNLPMHVQNDHKLANMEVDVLEDNWVLMPPSGPSGKHTLVFVAKKITMKTGGQWENSVTIKCRWQRAVDDPEPCGERTHPTLMPHHMYSVHKVALSLKSKLIEANRKDMAGYPNCRFCGCVLKIVTQEMHSRYQPVCADVCATCGYRRESDESDLRAHYDEQGPCHKIRRCMYDDCEATAAAALLKHVDWEMHRAHIEAYHDGLFRFICGICEKVFDEEIEQLMHRKDAHNNGTCREVGCEKRVAFHEEESHAEWHRSERAKLTPKAREICHLCGRTPKSLSFHMKQVHPARMLSCDQCGREFKEMQKLKWHIASKHTEDHLKPFACEYCGRRYGVKQMLAEHVVKLHLSGREKPHKCAHCPQEFFKPHFLRKHLFESHGLGEKLAPAAAAAHNVHRRAAKESRAAKMESLRAANSLETCRTCGFHAPKPKVMFSHFVAHGPLHVVDECMYANCRVALVNWAQHKRHIDQYHYGKKLEVCGKCGLVFSNVPALRKHKAKDHAVEKNYECDVCGNKYTAKSTLYLHKKYHENKPVSCEACGKQFPNRAYMKKHAKDKHGEKLFKCTECDKCFVNHARLTTHGYNVHTADTDKPYQCEYCNKGYGTWGNYNEHVNQKHKGAVKRIRKKAGGDGGGAAAAAGVAAPAPPPPGSVSVPTLQVPVSVVPVVIPSATAAGAAATAAATVVTKAFVQVEKPTNKGRTGTTVKYIY